MVFGLWKYIKLGEPLLHLNNIVLVVQYIWFHLVNLWLNISDVLFLNTHLLPFLAKLLFECFPGPLLLIESISDLFFLLLFFPHEPSNSVHLLHLGVTVSFSLPQF